MISFLFGFQIFITILISLIIVFQKSSSDGIVVSNNGGQISSNAQHSFISKFTIFLIFIFMANSLILARNSISQNKESSAIIKSLESDNISKDVIVSDDNVPKME